MRRHLATGLAILLGVPALGILAFAVFQPIKVLPRLQLAPGFALIDQDGQPLTSESLRGGITLFSFANAGCPSGCDSPIPLLQQVQAQLAVEDLGVPVRLVTIAVDPGGDAPEALRALGLEAGANFAAWRFAAGRSTRETARVLTGFDVYSRETADGGLELDRRLWLADGWGVQRAEYSSYWPSAARVLRDIRLVAAEARSSQGWERYAYEAAHLFGCYSN